MMISKTYKLVWDVSNNALYYCDLLKVVFLCFFLTWYYYAFGCWINLINTFSIVLVGYFCAPWHDLFKYWIKYVFGHPKNKFIAFTLQPHWNRWVNHCHAFHGDFCVLAVNFNLHKLFIYCFSGNLNYHNMNRWLIFNIWDLKQWMKFF